MLFWFNVKYTRNIFYNVQWKGRKQLTGALFFSWWLFILYGLIRNTQPFGTLPNGVVKYCVGGLVGSKLANAHEGWLFSKPFLRHCCCSKLYSFRHLAQASYKLHSIGFLFTSDCFALENRIFITGAAFISAGRGLYHDHCICLQVRSAGTDYNFIIT